jgi:hypothetical protein
MIEPVQKFRVGEKVVARSIPGEQLTIRRFADRIYYCRLVMAPDSPDLIYFERELKVL